MVNRTTSSSYPSSISWSSIDSLLEKPGLGGIRQKNIQNLDPVRLEAGPKGFDSICECSFERINWLSANLWSKKKKKQSNRLFAHFR